MSGRVILTYARSLMSLTAAHALGKRGIEIIGCDDVGLTVINFSRYVSDYFIHARYQDNLEQYLDDMEQNIRKFKPEDDRPYILMPMFRDAKVLAQFRARFEPLIKIAVPPYKAIEQIHPKDIFALTCEKLGLHIPKTYQPQDCKALENLGNELKFPLLIKPVDDVGGRGICKAANFEELGHFYNESSADYDHSPIIQEMVDGEDYCLSILCNKGEIVAHMAYKNLYQYPRNCGAGVMRETVNDDPFLQPAQRLMRHLKWHGVAQFDFRWDGTATNPPYLIEVNARFWAGLFHSVESGVDFPWMLYQLFAYDNVQDDSLVEIGSKTKVPGIWAIPALQEIAECDTNFEKLKTVWKETWKDNKDEGWRQKFKYLADALKQSVDAKDLMLKIKTMHERGQQAKSEFSAEDDPFTGLGFLFVASSLLRHGQLPPELKHEG